MANANLSLNAVLMKFFNLPPAVRMVLAVAGFGSLASIVYFLLPALRTKQGRLWILIIGAIGLAVFGLIYLVVRAVRGRRASKLDGALQSQGPTRGDVAEQEQIYREKFRGKLAELKANGLSVYRLPWFVLIGEPGCGKTASLIHSGLDYPLGRDEVPGFGGTRNYNWWFTNDAVILDTAGRIAFHEEGTTDRVEWEYFLKLLRAHRPRCPINGVVVALPADKLLRDSAEERAQKATVLRERLRQVHQALGVRFPTFVLVTKMDLVGGFREFFEEIRVDLQQRNQMFGWSRSGEFQTPFDPEEFPQAFDQVYYRLRDWSMRYLQRKATDEELGLIVTFPEAFRQLRGALADYIGTVFQKSPLLEPPFFRGFYFTSAVQEGAPIFDIFTRRRPGVSLPERPVRAVDSKAFFIHDFYERKVFAEHGLVFRSARHVTLNRRMRRLVWVGSAALLVLMLGLFAFGYFGVSELVTRPREDCARAAQVIAAKMPAPDLYERLADNLELAQRLQRHYQAYDRSWAGLRARALFVAANIREPRDSVRLIHARFVLEAILAPILRETERRLATMEELGRAPDRYLAALEVYTHWYGELVGQAARQPLNDEQARQRSRQLETCLEFLATADPTRVAVATQVRAALESLASQRRYFAQQVLRDTVGWEGPAATEVVQAGLRNLTQRWLPLTRLGSDPRDEFLRYWLRLANRLADVHARYQAALDLAVAFRQGQDYEVAARRFLELTDGVDYLGKATTPPKPETLARAWYDLQTFLTEQVVPQTEAKRIKRFADQRRWIEAAWAAEFGRVLEALRVGAPNEGERPQRDVYAAIAAAQQELGKSYDLSLAELRQKLSVPPGAEPLEHYVSVVRLLRAVEAQAALPTFDDSVASLRLAERPFGPYDELVAYLTELRELVAAGTVETDLNDLRAWPALLSRGAGSAPTGPRLRAWFDALAGRPGEEDVRQTSGLAEQPFWRPVELHGLADAVWFGHQQRTVGSLLEKMQSRCAAAAGAPTLPGLARLLPGFDDRVDELPFRRHVIAPEPTVQPEPPAPTEPQDEDWRRRRRGQADQAPAEPQAAAPAARDQELAPLVRYHTRVFLWRTLDGYDQVQRALQAHGARGEPLRTALSAALDAYIDRYFLDWNGVYDDFGVLLDGTTLTFLSKCREGAYDWPAFQAELKRIGPEITDQFALRLEAIVRDVVLFADVLPADERGDALFTRVDARLRALGPRQNLQDRLDDIGRTAAALARRRGEAVATLSEEFTRAWRDYLRQVERTGPDPKGVAKPPDQAMLREAYAQLVQWRRTKMEETRFIMPLLDIAAYGEGLLRHHLDRQLAAIFAADAGRYPIVADARDPDPALPRLRQLAGSALEPDRFIALLRAVTGFEQGYGALFAALHAVRTDPYVAALERCGAWGRFLYGEEAGRLPQELPVPLKVKWAVAKHEGTTSAGNFYNRMTITLPLLSEGGLEPVGPVEEAVRSGQQDSLPPSALAALAQREYRYRWGLFKRSGLDYSPPAVRVWDKNPAVVGPEQVVAPWQLPGNPWSLLLLVGSDPGNRLTGDQWIIPVLMQVANETIGFDIALQFERAFPGPIAPVADPGPPPAMEAAAKYLAGSASPRRQQP